MTETDFSSRGKGCLYGGAVGVAFGYAVEFKSLNTIHSEFGPEGIRVPVFQDASIVVSDDTQMTMFTLEGLLRSDLSDLADVNEQIRLSYIDWLSTQTPSEEPPTGALCQDIRLWHLRAPGNTCLSALRNGGWGTPDHRINDSKGCGGVMRVAPIGLVEHWTAQQVFDVAARAAAITHGHPSGFLSAGALAAMLRLLISEIDLIDAATMSCSILRQYDDSQETEAAIRAAIELSREHPGQHTEAVAQLGEGWVGEEALAIGLYAALSAQSFPEVFQIAANHDGDSDSTASIAGQIYGTWKGDAGLPEDWVSALDVYEPLASLIDGFCCQKVAA